MKKIKYIFAIIISLVFINIGLNSLNAASSTPPTQQLQKQNDAFNASAGFMTSDLSTLISLIIRTVLSLLAVIFLVLFIMAGFKWMTAAGNEAQVKEAQGTMKTAIIGLIIVLAAYSITYFVFNNIPFDMASPTNITTSG